eukprot:scaffold22635_cov134-Cylindrotheca_fusiformis.AAC.7
MEIDESNYGDYDLKTWLNFPQSSNWIQSLDPKAYVLAFWDQNTRPDGRMFSQARTTKVVTSLLKHSAGSALVKQGETKVMAAISIEIGQPTPELPDHGDIMVTVTTPDPRGRADRLQSWLQRMLDELLPRSLNLMSGKACIRLVTSVMILQDSGNLMDAALLACMAAWDDTSLPTMDQLQETQGKLWWKENPMTSVVGSNSEKTAREKEYRVSLTMGLLKSKSGKVQFLVDPSLEEAKFTEGQLTIVVSLPSRTLQVEYTGSLGLDAADMALATKLANGRADELSSIL